MIDISLCIKIHLYTSMNKLYILLEKYNELETYN